MSTSYANLGGSGDRRTIVGITASYTLMGGDVNTLTDLLDGTQGNSAFFNGNAVDSSAWIVFDFGNAVVIDEAKWYQDTTNSHGTWQWQGSNDMTSWTNIGSSFTFGGSNTQTQTSLNGNSTAYRFYRLLGVSGTTSSNPDTREIEFKIDGMLDLVNAGTSFANTGGSGDRSSSIVVTASGGLVNGSPLSNFVNGDLTDQVLYWNIVSLSGSSYLRFDFGSGASKVIDQCLYTQQNSRPQGLWKWQGSNNASLWTDIGFPFYLGGAANYQKQITALAGNLTGYRYYQMVGVSGSSSDDPYVFEFEFKIGDFVGGGSSNRSGMFFAAV